MSLEANQDEVLDVFWIGRLLAGATEAESITYLQHEASADLYHLKLALFNFSFHHSIIYSFWSGPWPPVVIIQC